MPDPTPKRPPRDNLVRAMSRSPELRDAAAGEMPTLVGHFAVFNQWTEINSMWEGEFMERIAPGAFKKTISEGRDQMRVLFNHGQDFQIGDKVLGKIEKLNEDKEGAYYEVPLFDTSYNRDLEPGLRAGQYGASFRFRVMKEEFVQSPKVSADNPRALPERTIKEAQVLEFGPVTFPAYAGASAGLRADAVRSLTDAFMVGEIVRDPVRLKELLEGAGVTARDTTTEPVETVETVETGERSEDAEAAAEAALPDEGAGDDPHSDDGSRGQEPTEPTSTAAPTTTETPPLPKENRQMPATQTIDERRARETAIKTRFDEIHAEYGASTLPPEVRSEWENLIAERNDNRASIADYENRTRQLATMAGDESRHEPIGLAEQARANRGSNHRGVPDNIYAIEDYRGLSNTLDDLKDSYRSGAMKVVERSTFPHPRAKADEAREQIAKLLDKDTADGALAQRFIVTGSPAYQRAFGKTLKGSPLSADEQRALSLGADADGGFAVPFQLDPTVILTSDGVINPIRSIARVERIIGKEWQGITSTGVTVSRADEDEEASDNSPTLVQPVVRAERVQGFIPFSLEIGQDWGSLQSEMATLLSDAKDTEESTSFILGTGVAPEAAGIVTKLPVGSIVTTITNDAFAVGDLYKLEEALAPRFRARAQFMANRAIYNKVRQFDTAGGASLWVRLLDKLGSELIGYTANEASAMDSTVADAKKILLLGDFKNFLIVDRIGMSIELIPHLFGVAGRPTGQRGIYAVWRNNSKILVDNAFRLLKVL